MVDLGWRVRVARLAAFAMLALLSGACDSGGQTAPESTATTTQVGPTVAADTPVPSPVPEPTATPGIPQGRRLLSQLPCPGIPGRPERRYTPPPDRVLQAEWFSRLCDLAIAPTERMARPFDIGAGELASLSLTEIWVHHFPGLADSNSPAYWLGDAMVMFNSFSWPSVSKGASVERLGPADSVAIYERVGGGGRWLESVWFDAAEGVLYGWYHREPELECLTAPVIGAAISYDFGASWTDQGVVISDSHPIDCAYENGYFTGGSGDFSVILDPAGEYFYFLYTNYGGPLEEQGVGIARSALADRGQPGTVVKCDGSAWAQPGVSGTTHPLFASVTSWAGPVVDSFWGPSVHWNTYLQRYVVLLNRTNGVEWEQEGVYVSFSADMLTWTAPEKILDTNYWYAQVVGLGAGETEAVAGQTARLYVGGMSPYTLEFRR
jgi:hypothetical protein